MGRETRIEIRNAIYHVTQHATGDEVLFRDAFDRLFFEQLLERALKRYAWDLHAYCQLDNHYHVLLRLRRLTLAAGMQFLNSRYVRGFNERHGRRGTLVRARYTSTLVETDDHYVSCVAYIAMNPVGAGLCPRPEDWEWGTYGSSSSLARRPGEPLRGFIDAALA
jgi:REP element-mobilizing transposase RayT